MESQKRQLVILFIVLGVVVVAFFGITKYNEFTKTKVEDKTVRLFNHPDIDKISYGYSNMTQIVSMEKVNGQWVDVKDSSVTLDSILVDGIVSIPSNIEYEDKIENVTDFEQYGLETPSVEIICYDKNKEYMIQIGNFSSTIYKYYIRINNEDTVYTVDNTLFNTFTKSTASLQVRE